MKNILIICGLLITGFYFLKPPAEIAVRCETTKGPLALTIVPAWSPKGAARFLELVQDGYFKDLPLHRCVENFLCQAGAKPAAQTYPPILDDPPTEQFRRGSIAFAGTGRDSRTKHFFIVLGDGVGLGTQPWETPIGKVIDAPSFHTGYGDMPPYGTGPDPAKIEAADGADYLKREFPNLDYIISCAVIRR